MMCANEVIRKESEQDEVDEMKEKADYTGHIERRA